MNGRSLLRYLGIVLLVGGATRLSVQLELMGISSALFAVFAVGILLIARDPVRELSARVRSLEEQLARYRNEDRLAS
jgi:hypothetical protein